MKDAKNVHVNAQKKPVTNMDKFATYADTGVTVVVLVVLTYSIAVIYSLFESIK